MGSVVELLGIKARDRAANRGSCARVRPHRHTSRAGCGARATPELALLLVVAMDFRVFGKLKQAIQSIAELALLGVV
jgi:hypothetical protein